MSRTVWWSIVVFGLGLVAAIIYYALPKAHREPDLQFPPAAVAPSQPAAPEPQTHFPAPQETGGTALPALDESDRTLKQALDSLWSETSTAGFFNIKDLIRRIVVTVDNLPRRKVALRLMPVKQAAGKFETTGGDQDFAIAPDNATRYAAYARFAGAIDAGKLVALYAHFYPLFQQAYQDLGYPNGYFNDRLIETIDDLLAAPEVKTPVRLARPKVFYEFADPELEARSAGQKILMRIGNDNAARIKTKLREIRSELIRNAPKS